MLTTLAIAVLILIVTWRVGSFAPRVGGIVLVLVGLVMAAAGADPLAATVAVVLGVISWLGGHWLFALRHHEYRSCRARLPSTAPRSARPDPRLDRAATRRAAPASASSLGIRRASPSTRRCTSSGTSSGATPASLAAAVASASISCTNSTHELDARPSTVEVARVRVHPSSCLLLSSGTGPPEGPDDHGGLWSPEPAVLRIAVRWEVRPAARLRVRGPSRVDALGAPRGRRDSLSLHRPIGPRHHRSRRNGRSMPT